MAVNKGFTFYDGFWNAVSSLPEAQQKDVVYSIVKYGMTGELPTDPIAHSMTMAFKMSIDKSVERIGAGASGRPSKIKGEELKEFLAANVGITAKEVAEHFGVSESTIQKRDEWKNRNSFFTNADYQF